MQTVKWDGQPISKPGMYSGIDIDIYHSAKICDGPSISSSGLRKIFSESPAHFYAGWRGNPNYVEPDKESRHFIVGRAAHHLHLGQPGFARLFIIQPKEYETEDGGMKAWSNNAKECRKWHADRRDEGRSVLTEKEVEVIKGMALKLGEHPIVKAGALNGYVERSIFYKDESTGIWIKVRPDAIPGDSGDFVDYKTTTSVQFPDLVRTIGELGYHQQGALICEASRKVLNINSPTFSLVFQEKSNPFCVRVVTLKDNDLARGAKQNRFAIDTFARCLKSKKWPGPGGDREDAENIELSEYAQKSIDDRLLILGG